MIVSDPAVTPAALLAGPPPSSFDLPRELWGFGGLHGGLSLALLMRAMQDRAGDASLRGLAGRFHRPLRAAFDVTVSHVRTGRSVMTLAARAESGDATHVDASATFAAVADGESATLFAPPAPGAPPPEECERFEIPLEFVPFARHTEIRPVGRNRPFAGGRQPVLTAWVRLVGDRLAPDESRLVMLMDALAPSYSAVLSTPVLIPTVELAVHPARVLSRAASPWVLLRAATRAVSGGWVDEQIDAWDRDGRYLGSGHQLRLVTAGP